MYIWLRKAKFWNRVFILTPVVLGAAAGLTFFQNPGNAAYASILAILTGLLPAIRSALRLDLHLDQIKSLAAEFKGLQDAFRQLAYITAPADNDAALKKLDTLMERLARARAHSVTIPERVFKEAQRKIKSGDYDASVDMKKD